MAQSIGDLFITLGFKVDDQKLKDFNDSVNATFQGILKFAGVDLGVQGLKNIAVGAANSALWMRDLNAQFGTSYEFMQKFQGQWAHLNPLDDPNAAGRIETNLENYRARYAAGQGGWEAGRFGVTAADSTEQMIDKIRTQIPIMLANHIPRAFIEQWVTAIFGDSRAMVFLQAKKEELDIAGQLYNQTEKQRQETVQAAEAIQNLHLAWDNFFNHVVASMATGILELDKDIAEEQAKMPGKRGFFAGVGRFTDWLGSKDIYGLEDTGKDLIHNTIMDAAVGAVVGMVEGGAAGNRKDAIAFWQSKGYSAPQIAGWLAQEQAESTFGTNQNMNKNGHFGAFQWSAERAARIKSGTGIDVKTAPHWKQLEAAEWEFNNMHLDSAYRRLNNANDASEFLSKKFEIHEKINAAHGDEAAYRARIANQNMASGDITNNVTISVQSTADASDVAERVHQRFIEVTYPQVNKGGY